MTRNYAGVWAAAAAASLVLGCGSDESTLGATDGGVLADSNVLGGDTGPGPVIVPPDSGNNPPPVDCQNAGPDGDFDKDGFSTAAGDCDDCDPIINPGSFDVPGNAGDEDCSGSAAQAAEDDCDRDLPIDSTSAEDAARALGLCKFTQEDKRDWGVLSARYTTVDGRGTLANPLMTGIVPDFGTLQPLAGASMLALSTGVARTPSQPGYTEECDNFSLAGAPPPAGYPKNSSNCDGSLFGFPINSTIFDQAVLELKLRVPKNANSLSFDSIFFSYEFPDYVCSAYNDFYVVFQEPSKTPDPNIVFDVNKDSIGINSGLLAVCDPTLQPPGSRKTFACEQGTRDLDATGFGNGEYTCGTQLFSEDKGKGGASTGWLHTVSPVEPGAIITLRFATWDTNDNDVDSTVVIDKFVWSVEKSDGATTVAVPPLR